VQAHNSCERVLNFSCKKTFFTFVVGQDCVTMGLPVLTSSAFILLLTDNNCEELVQ
jgi:hypothetical protein